MVLFGFFSLVLVSVYWVNQAVVLFDRLIADGHSANVFLEFTALSLPNVIRMVLPMSAFAAAVYVTNRLSSESELTVVQATGYSPWRIARPVLMFGAVVALMMSLLTHYLVPASLEQLKLRENEISGNLSARLLREGAFLHPTKGVTFYIRDISEDGALRDVFLSDRRQSGRSVTYTAKEAYLLRDAEGPKLVMVSGLAQTFSENSGQLSTTTFNDFSYDISALITQRGSVSPKLRYLPTAQLLFDTQSAMELTDKPAGEVMEEAHGRINQALLCIVAALIGFSALLVGGFSRFGIGRQIIAAIFLLVLVKLVESAVTEPVGNNAALWPLIYAPSFVGLVIAFVLLWKTDHPYAFKRKRSVEAL